MKKIFQWLTGGVIKQIKRYKPYRLCLQRRFKKNSITNKVKK